LVREALHRMRLGPVSLGNILSRRRRAAKPAAGQADAVEGTETKQQQLYQVLERLQPLIIRSVKMETGRPLLSVVPLTPRSVFRPGALSPDLPVRLSTFAELRTDGHEYRLESPLALHRVLLHRAEAVRLIGALGRPSSPAEAAAVLPRHEAVAMAGLEYLTAAGMVAQAQAQPDRTGEPPIFAEDTDLALAGWSPADLMFHTRSTLSRHDDEFGITYPMDEAGVSSSGEPVIKPEEPRNAIALHRPRWDDLCAADPPLTVAVEGRRSVRDHGGDPVTLTELGDLLYRTCRVRLLSDTGGARHQALGVVAIRELSDRPYPGGGACYELELYITAGRCAGLPPGVYHYDPLGHRLEPVNSDPAAVSGLLLCARTSAAMDGPPQVLITLTARVRRLSWKYQGLPYRIALMDAGVLIQSLYLICTAMRLAPCALGAVSGELTARAFGTDWRTEPGIAQFMVGRASAGYRRPGVWHPENDGDWAKLSHARLSPEGTPS
jgi:SagB-type dehydrogenase family enzyme